MERRVVGACLAHRDIKLPNTIHRFLLFSHHCIFFLHPITSRSHPIDPDLATIAFTIVHHTSFVPRHVVSSPLPRPPAALARKLFRPEHRATEQAADNNASSGIFGYINYLVEKDRKYILDTLINGKCCPLAAATPAQLPRGGAASRIKKSLS